MSADVATLGLAVDSGPVRTATTALNEFGDAASKSEGRVKSILSATDALVAGLNRNTAANNATASSVAAMQSALAATVATMSTLVNQQAKAADSESVLVSALTRTVAGRKLLTDAVNTNTEAVGKHVTAQKVAIAADNDAGTAVDALKLKYDALAKAKADALVTGARADHVATQSQSNVNTLLGVTRAPTKSAQDSAGVFREYAEAQETEEKRINSMREAVDPLWASQNRLNATIAQADELRKKGLVSQETYNQKVATATRAHEQLEQHVRGSTTEVGIAGHQLQNLSFQLNDAATMAASGADAFQIFATQAGQIFQIGQSATGGFRGILTQVGDATSALASRIGLTGFAVGSLAAGFAVAATAAASFRSEQKELERSMFGVGRASGATLQDLQNSANQAAAGGKTSAPAAREVVGALNSTGRVNPRVYADVAATIPDMAKVMGTDVPAATETMVAALSKGVQGFDSLNSIMVLGDDNFRNRIEDLYESGNAYKAQAEIVEAWGRKVREAAPKPGILDAFSDFGRNTSNEFSAIGSIFRRRTQEESLAGARNALRNGQAQVDAGLAPASSLDAARANVEKLEASLAKSALGAKETKLALDSLSVGPLVQSLNPAQKRIEDITNKAKEIEKYLADGGVDKDGASRRTMDGLNAQAKQLAEELARGGTGLANSLSSVQFQLKTAGFSDYAKSQAGLEEAARKEKEGIVGQNLEPSARDAQVKAVEERLALQIKLLQEETLRTAQAAQQTGGGKFNKTVMDAPPEMRAAILRSAAQYGQDPDQISSMLWQESKYKNGLTSSAGAKGVAQFMPDTAKQYGVDVNNVESSIMGMGKYLQALGKMFGNGTADQIAAYNWGEGNRKNWIENGRNPATQPKETRDYVASITTAGPGSNELTKEMADRARALKLEADITRMTTEAGGRDAEGLQARIEVLRETSAAEARNQTVSKESIAILQQEAATRAKLATEARMSSFTVDGQWTRDQIGRDRGEQAAYSAARNVTGSTDMSTTAARQVIRETQSNNDMLEAKSITTEALNGLAGDLRRGASAADTFYNVLNRIGDRLASSVIDSAVSSAFKGLSSGGGEGGNWLTNLFKFANGGIMTNAGPMELRRYASGGVANSPQLAMYGEAGPEAYVPLPDGRNIPVKMQGGAANTNSGGGMTVVVNEASGGDRATVTEKRGPGGSMTAVVTMISREQASQMSRGQGPLAAVNPGAKRLRG